MKISDTQKISRSDIFIEELKELVSKYNYTMTIKGCEFRTITFAVEKDCDSEDELISMDEMQQYIEVPVLETDCSTIIVRNR